MTLEFIIIKLYRMQQKTIKMSLLFIYTILRTLLGKERVISLIGLCKNQSISDQIGLNSNANVLVIGCEGLTDQEMFDKLLNQGLKQIQ